MRARITIVFVHYVSLEDFFVVHHFAAIFTSHFCLFVMDFGHVVDVMRSGTKALAADATGKPLDSGVNVGYVPFQIITVDKGFAALITHVTEGTLVDPFGMMTKFSVGSKGLGASLTRKGFVGHL